MLFKILCKLTVLVFLFPCVAQAIDLPPSSGGVVLQNTYPGTATFTVQPGVTIANTGTAVTGNNSQNWNFTNHGALTSTSAANNTYSGLQLGSATPGASVVTNYGVISSVSTKASGSSGVRFIKGGIVYNEPGGSISGFDGVHSDGGPLIVYNKGLITCINTGGSAVYAGAGAAVYNYAGGTISGLHFAINLNGHDKNALIDNAGLIEGGNTSAINFTNGAAFAVINRPGGQITGQGSAAININAALGYLVNEGTITGTNNAFGANSTTGNILVNAGVMTAGNNGYGIQTGANDTQATIYNFGTLSGAGSGQAVLIGGSNSLLVLGTQVFLPRLGRLVTGPGSVLSGNAVSTGANNRVLLTDSGTEDSSLLGFAALSMNGQAWTLSAPLALSSTAADALAATAGTLTLRGPLTTPGGISVNSNARLVTVSNFQASSITLNSGNLDASGDIIAASANALGKSSLEMSGMGQTVSIPAINVASGAVFGLLGKDARVTLAPGTALNMAPGALYGITISRDVNAHSIMYADSFAPAEGVALNLPNVGDRARASGISSLPPLAGLFTGVVQTNNPVVIPKSMQVLANPLLTLGLIPAGNNADLAISLRNINDVFGPNLRAADIWRITQLPGEDQRARLNSVYRTGRLDDDSRRFFELLQGGPVLVAQEVQRANLRIFTNTIRERLAQNTDYDSAINTAEGSFTGSATAPAAGDSLGQSDGSGALWAAGAYHWVKQDSRSADNLRGYSYTPYTVTLGAEYARGAWRVGLAGQFAEGTASSLNGSDTDIEVQSGIFGLYGQYQYGAWYAQTGVQAGMAKNEAATDWDDWGGATRGNFTTSLWGANAEIGYAAKLGNPAEPWAITPHLGIEVGTLWQDDFSESGDAGLTRSFDSNTYTIFEVPVGLRLEKTIQLETVRLVPYADFIYAHNFADTFATTTAQFTHAPGDNWLVNGIDSGREAFRLRTGLAAYLSPKASLSLDYGLEARDRGYTAQDINLSVGLQF